MQYSSFFSLLTLFIIMTSCKKNWIPKPSAHLRLDYPAPVYSAKKTACGFTFNMNNQSKLAATFKKNSCALEIKYPNLNATIFLTHRTINNDLRKLLTDAQNLTQEHVVKADDIRPSEYLNPDTKVYGMIYKVIGDAASPSQFYVTDSVQNFLLGSVYFKAAPNYDSILPAAAYLRKDMRILIESLQWNTPKQQ